MTLDMNIAGADFSAAAVGYFAPVTRGLTGLFLLGGTLAKSEQNLASGGAGSSVVGSPGIGAASITGSFGNYLKTSLVDTPSQTIILACMMATQPTGAPNIIAYEGSIFGAGHVIESSSSALDIDVRAYFTPTAGGTAVSAQSSTTLSAVGAWNMVAVLQDGSGQTLQIKNLSTGAAGAAVATGGTIALSTSPILLGSSPLVTSTTINGPASVALAEYHNVVLTPTELTSIYSYYKTVLASRGVNI